MSYLAEKPHICVCSYSFRVYKICKLLIIVYLYNASLVF